jgi:hypothetical protein
VSEEPGARKPHAGIRAGEGQATALPNATAQPAAPDKGHAKLRVSRFGHKARADEASISDGQSDQIGIGWTQGESSIQMAAPQSRG